MGPNKAEMTYATRTSRQDSFAMLKAVAIPILLYVLTVFTINSFAAFGTKIISPASVVMWGVGFFVALFMPSEREEVLRQTLSISAIYCFTMLGLKLALGLVSGASSEMIAASFNQSIPTTTGNALPGIIQNILWYSSFGIPAGYIIMQVKRLVQFSHKQSLQKTFRKVRGVNNAGKPNTRSWKR